MGGARQVLVLGDGDGRFTAALLARWREARVVAIDSSRGMLALLAARVEALGAASRLTALHDEAVSFLAGSGEAIAGQPAAGFDHVCSHFFLDCLTTAEVCRLVDGVCPRLAPGAVWIVSEFAADCWWRRLVVELLYGGFALLAGLKVQQLPEWRRVLEAGGFVCEAEARSLGGLLTSTVWRWSR
jgi:ubiquinone/menaquinone biosynthesis C-methylase UbiE